MMYISNCHTTPRSGSAKRIMDDKKQPSNPDIENKTSSGMSPRFFILLGIGAILVASVWGYLRYIEASIPKGDPKFKKELANGVEEEPVQTNMEVLAEMFSGEKLTKEVEEIKGKSADEVAFTYEAIMKMSREELTTNIKELSQRLSAKRKSLPPSLGGARVGGGGQPDDGADKDEVSIASLALPLEVMRQVLEKK